MTKPNLKLNIHLTETNEEQTCLEQYIQSQLATAGSTEAWNEVKELLGKKMKARDSELVELKSHLAVSVALNIGLICGFGLYRIFNRS
jgi:hypothetical protein